MNFLSLRSLALGLTGLHLVSWAFGTNPLILDQFTADPTARVFEGRVYVYPSHDIKPPPGYKGRPDWFCMEDYHVFSSANLTDWTDHGVVLNQTIVPWADPTAYSFWAPDCVSRNGRYFLFFPAIAKTGGFRIGVAVSDKPSGPFTPSAKPIEGVRGIDPCVFIDRDSTPYLYFSSKKIFMAKLRDDLQELAEPVVTIDHLPIRGLLEGPFVFERDGLYYLTYPHVEHTIERLEYATSTSPRGPFKPAGVILDESESGCWTVHHSIVEYQGKWYLFYHDKDLSPDFDKHRSIRADRLYFNPDGTIQKVIPTLRGVGIVSAQSRIQIDRYSATSAVGTKVSFLDPENSTAGWTIAFTKENTWSRYNAVDFGFGPSKTIEVRATSAKGGTIEIRIDRLDGPLVARVEIGPDADWKTIAAPLLDKPNGVHDLFVRHLGRKSVEIDWLRFP